MASLYDAMKSAQESPWPTGIKTGYGDAQAQKRLPPAWRYFPPGEPQLGLGQLFAHYLIFLAMIEELFGSQA